jgi:alanine dehydrogenase
MKSGFEKLAQSAAMQPQEKMLEVKKKNNNLSIGLPKETAFQENRIVLTPEAVKLLVNNGHEIMLESGAGLPSKYTDREYSEAGAKIVYSTKEVYQAQIVLKIEPPTKEESEFLNHGSVLISAIQYAHLKKESLEPYIKKKITTIGFELIRDKVGGMPIVRAMSEIAGSTVMLIAAEYLSNSKDGKGVILGGITGVPSTQVVILGAGTVAEFAGRAALGLGAEVKVFDNHLYRLRRIKYQLGQQVYTSILDTNILSEALKKADVVIGAMHAEDGRSLCIVTDDMVSQMRPNSVVIDVSIDSGGCFETSKVTNHDKPTYKVHDVIHYCVPNLPSRVARTASMALSNVFTPILLSIGDYGGIEDYIANKEGFRAGVYCYNGGITNKHISEKFNLKYKDLSLLFATKF